MCAIFTVRFSFSNFAWAAYSAVKSHSFLSILALTTLVQILTLHTIQPPQKFVLMRKCAILHGRRRERREDVEGLGKAPTERRTHKDVQAGPDGSHRPKVHKSLKDALQLRRWKWPQLPICFPCSPQWEHTGWEHNWLDWFGKSLNIFLERKSLTEHQAEVTQQLHHPNDCAEISWLWCQQWGRKSQYECNHRHPPQNYTHHIWLRESIKSLWKCRQRQKVIGSPQLVFFSSFWFSPWRKMAKTYGQATLQAQY